VCFLWFVTYISYFEFLAIKHVVLAIRHVVLAIRHVVLAIKHVLLAIKHVVLAIKHLAVTAGRAAESGRYAADLTVGTLLLCGVIIVATVVTDAVLRSRVVWLLWVFCQFASCVDRSCHISECTYV
jgi:hypothetical protein